MKDLVFDDNGLITVVVQHAETGEIRMVGWANAQAVEQTRKSGYVHFYSRSRETLWKKGETSGNTLRVVSMQADCDGDTLLVQALPDGPTCHTGTDTCFFETVDVDQKAKAAAGFNNVLAKLEAIVVDRKLHPKDGSYTNELLREGSTAIGRKVMEEALEVILAAKDEGPQRLASEAGDLLYHLAVLLVDAGVSFEAVAEELAARHR